MGHCDVVGGGAVPLSEPCWVEGEHGLVNLSLCYGVAIYSPNYKHPHTWIVVAHPARTDAIKAVPLAICESEEEARAILGRLAEVSGSVTLRDLLREEVAGG